MDMQQHDEASRLVKATSGVNDRCWCKYVDINPKMLRSQSILLCLDGHMCKRPLMSTAACCCQQLGVSLKID